MSNWVFEATGYHVQWEEKELDGTLKDSLPANDEIVTEIVINKSRGAS
jgi:hypothetical protein